LTGLIDFALAQNFVIAAIFFYAGVDSSLVNWRRFRLRWLRSSKALFRMVA